MCCTSFHMRLCLSAQVITWIKKQSEQFFPLRMDYNTFPADPRELEEKLKKFKLAAQVGAVRVSKAKGHRQKWGILMFCCKFVNPEATNFE